MLSRREIVELLFLQCTHSVGHEDGRQGYTEGGEQQNMMTLYALDCLGSDVRDLLIEVGRTTGLGRRPGRGRRLGGCLTHFGGTALFWDEFFGRAIVIRPSILPARIRIGIHKEQPLLEYGHSKTVSDRKPGTKNRETAARGNQAEIHEVSGPNSPVGGRSLKPVPLARGKVENGLAEVGHEPTTQARSGHDALTMRSPHGRDARRRPARSLRKCTV